MAPMRATALAVLLAALAQTSAKAPKSDVALMTQRVKQEMWTGLSKQPDDEDDDTGFDHGDAIHQTEDASDYGTQQFTTDDGTDTQETAADGDEQASAGDAGDELASEDTPEDDALLQNKKIEASKQDPSDDEEDYDTLDTSSSEDKEGEEGTPGDEGEAWTSEDSAEDDTLSLAHKGSKTTKQDPSDVEASDDEDYDTLDTSSSEDKEGVESIPGDEDETFGEDSADDRTLSLAHKSSKGTEQAATILKAMITRMSGEQDPSDTPDTASDEMSSDEGYDTLSSSSGADQEGDDSSLGDEGEAFNSEDSPEDDAMLQKKKAFLAKEA